MPAGINAEQILLFPIDPRGLADAIGLDWWAAKKLYDAHGLSFDPETTLINTDGLDASSARWWRQAATHGCSSACWRGWCRHTATM